MTMVHEEGDVSGVGARAPWRIGTRGSLLALTQAGTVRDALVAAGQPAELVVVKTAGDLSQAPVQEIGVGVFTTALREELARGSVDIAVHSYKDLPTARDPRFVIAAVPPRADPRDALVARDGLVLGELPAGSRIGTSAPRRAAQLLALGLGLEIVPLRGNLETRLRKVADGELDAVVVARAGLARIERTDAVTEALEPVQMLPAPAQGALAVECRIEDTELVEIVRGLDDAASRAAVVAERGLLAELEAGCTAPVGALAEVVESLDDDGRIVEELSLRGCAAAIDGSDVVRASIVGAPERADELGRALARELLDLGARELLGAAGAARPEIAAGDGDPTPRTATPSAPDVTHPSPMENTR
ncbi:hydroxymethylbilane synthase [Nocardia harenae]|uniref:hydroxymethylbilane synthase n=1 Tax=Nocardia harenae TaxID=358707 RepID=UPI00082CD4B5|nr:hydroxymethylbilane synthase [Nocardia harenae]